MLPTTVVAQMSVVSAGVLLSISFVTILLTAREINDVYSEAMLDLNIWKNYSDEAWFNMKSVLRSGFLDKRLHHLEVYHDEVTPMARRLTPSPARTCIHRGTCATQKGTDPRRTVTNSQEHFDGRN
ncbi:hypothetical protein KIN20_005522 [Parelaphostrongylus tenuis]|uniref:Nematode cuticle collagen N-terminal domain-containing protein n=1 Tax=Parelaphostrongylus tenuis TaxID=148309 RepID=A0AAD5MLM2_PARTN|nr:hypothetical protein KIN20_005522 [Parelaphostrongylus tenuis]